MLLVGRSAPSVPEPLEYDVSDWSRHVSHVVSPPYIYSAALMLQLGYCFLNGTLCSCVPLDSCSGQASEVLKSSKPSEGNQSGELRP